MSIYYMRCMYTWPFFTRKSPKRRNYRLITTALLPFCSENSRIPLPYDLSSVKKTQLRGPACQVRVVAIYSSVSPSIQNIKVKKMGKKDRKAFL